MSLQVLMEIQTAPCHRPVMLHEEGWEKTNCEYKCTFGQQKGREPVLHTHRNARGWLGRAVSSIQGKTGGTMMHGGERQLWWQGTPGKVYLATSQVWEEKMWKR